MIVNADDFGRDANVNAAILSAFEAGLVSSATIMANQPGFEEAAELVRTRRLTGHVGLHVVLTSGTPLTDAIRREPRFCDADGQFGVFRNHRTLRLSGDERTALLAEIGSQIQRAADSGLQLTHLDSHHHVHTDWMVGSCIIEACEAFSIPHLRLARNAGPHIGVASRLYKRAYNKRLTRAGLAATRWFGEVQDFTYAAHTQTGGAPRESWEVMTHPVLDESGSVVEAGAGLLAEHVNPVIRSGPLVSYAGTRYAG